MARGVSMPRDQGAVGPGSPDGIDGWGGSEGWTSGCGFWIETLSDQSLADGRVLFGAKFVPSRETHAREILPILVETLRKICELADLAQPQMEVDDFSIFELFSITLDSSQCVSAI